MTLNEITNQLLNIANETENNTMFDNRLAGTAKKQHHSGREWCCGHLCVTVSA